MSTVIHRSDRPKREFPPRHPRLIKLDEDLMKSRSKAFDTVNLVGPGFSVPVTVMRDMDNRFFATAQVGRAYRIQGGSPSGAVLMLQITIKRDLAWKQRAEKETIKAIFNATT